MSSSRELSASFSSQNLRVPGTQVSRKRKRLQHTHSGRRRRSDYKRTDGGQELDKHLCSRCRLIDFEAIFEIEPDETITDHGINVYDLGNLPPFSKDAPCKLCQLFALILLRNQQHESSWHGDWHLRAFTTGTFRNMSHTAASRAQDLSIVIALSPKPDMLSEHNRVECIDRGVILPWYDVSDPDPSEQGLCRIITCPREVGFSRVEEMLLSCDADHFKCRQRQGDTIPFPVRARVIDCQAREIVSLTPECTYLALSYVWGPKNPEELSFLNDQDSKLTKRLPLTLEDAISITKALGLRYLWVDRICIAQGRQTDDTQFQIAQMNRIYSHAYATLCALGDDDGVGLPGCSSHRKRQLRVQTQDLILSWTGPSIRRNLKSSKWSTRGWTYQESVLSRRCLFFTEHFVALVCDSETSIENVSFNYFHTWSFNKESELYGDATGGRVLHPAQEFDRHLQQFQSRQLSYVADTLNAFKGILSQLSVQTYWGVPIYRVIVNEKTNTYNLREKEHETGFITGLCWKVTKSSHTIAPGREEFFPSWSWVGQKHAKVFANCIARSYQLEVAQIHFSVFQAMVRIKSTDDKLVSLKQLAETHSTAQIIREQTRFLEIRSVMIRWQGQINPRRKNGWVEGGLDAYQIGENGWWRSDYIGDLYLDPSYDELTKPHDECDDQDQICRHLPLKSGTAILLALNVKSAGNHTVARAVWLVVKQIKGGSYLRKGIIISNQSVKSRSPISCPTEDMLETILLG